MVQYKSEQQCISITIFSLVLFVPQSFLVKRASWIISDWFFFITTFPTFVFIDSWTAKRDVRFRKIWSFNFVCHEYNSGLLFDLFLNSTLWISCSRLLSIWLGYWALFHGRSPSDFCNAMRFLFIIMNKYLDRNAPI